MNTSILPQNYQLLVQDCREIVVEHEFISRWTLIEGYHALGKRILKFKLKPSHVTQLAKDIDRSPRTVQRSIQFYKKYPDLNMLPEGKNVSWHSICNKYLPETTKEKKPVYITCEKCGWRREK